MYGAQNGSQSATPLEDSHVLSLLSHFECFTYECSLHLAHISSINKCISCDKLSWPYTEGNYYNNPARVLSSREV
jgi:hypothetical protein